MMHIIKPFRHSSSFTISLIKTIHKYKKRLSKELLEILVFS